MISSDKKAQIVASLKTNPNACQIAKQQGCSDATVRRIAADLQIDLTAGKRLRGWLSDETRATAVAELKTQPSFAAVARKVGCGKVAVGRLVKDPDVGSTPNRPPDTRSGRRSRLISTPTHHK